MDNSSNPSEAAKGFVSLLLLLVIFIGLLWYSHKTGYDSGFWNGYKAGFDEYFDQVQRDRARNKVHHVN